MGDWKSALAKAALLVGVLCCGVQGAEEFKHDFGEQVVNTRVEWDFADNAREKNYQIVSGRMDQPGAWGWNGSGSHYVGTVASNESFAGSHAGKFSGQMIRKGNGGAGGEGVTELIDWNGTLTGTAVDKCEHGIDKVEHRKVSDNYGFGRYIIATTCGHKGSKWKGALTFAIRDSSTNTTVKIMKTISTPVSTGTIWESNTTYFYNPKKGIVTESGDRIYGVDVDIKCAYTVSCVIEGKVCTKTHNE